VISQAFREGESSYGTLIVLLSCNLKGKKKFNLFLHLFMVISKRTPWVFQLEKFFRIPILQSRNFQAFSNK